MEPSDIRNRLREKGLKITPQRIAIYQAIVKLNNHPTADDIASYLEAEHPNIAVGTIYKVLDSLVVNGLLKRVKTEKDVMKYDAVIESHHHLHDADSDHIADYYNDEINAILTEYFRKNKIPDFEIEEIKLQINGKFIHKNQ